MHQSSFHIILRFRKLVEKNFSDRQIRILDVGSYGVNGTYREIFADPEKYSYTGLDVNPGPNVDYVPSDPYHWTKLPDQSFDVIVSGQAFEHIEYPWLIIEEISRVLKKNGLACIVAPSRGPEHKYPVDCWRYYPDAFRALAKWANLEVIESKTAWGKSGFTDGSDQWGDTFCILYKKENQSDLTRHKTKAKRSSHVINHNNPLKQNKQNSYYGFARHEVIDILVKNNIPAKKVLELGCAGGATGKNLKERVPVQEYVGIEISPEAADIAKNHLDKVIIADIEKTDLASEHGLKPGDFDLLLALDVLEHLYNPWDVLAELTYYLRPGGYVVASIPNVQNIDIVRDLVNGKWQYQDAGILDATHLRFFTIAEAQKMFTGAGLIIRSIDHVVLPSLNLPTMLESDNTYREGNLEISKLTKKELLDLYTYQYILIARKPSIKVEYNEASVIHPDLRKNALKPQFLHMEPVAQLTSIVILTFNQLEYTKKCVKSISKHTPENHEIIFIDNGSTDKTVQWLKTQVRENKKYTLIENKENLGFAKGCNQGIEASRGEYILLLNNDTVVADGWLSGLIDCLTYALDAGIVGPMTNNISGLQQNVSREYLSVDNLDKYAVKFRRQYAHRRIPLRRIVGFCMLFKRALAEQIGMLDESFGTGNFEDDDLCVRAALEGYRNYIAGDVFIHHFGSRSFIGNKINYSASISDNRKIIDKKWTLSIASPEGKKLAALKTTEFADILYQKGNLNKALETLVNGLKYSPNELCIYYEMLRFFIESKKFAEANDVITSIPEAARKDLKGLEYAGYCQEGLGMDDLAAQHAEAMLSLNQNYQPALNLLGILAFKKEEKEKAEIHFKKAIAADPGYGEAYVNLGVLYWGIDKKDEALSQLKKGFQLSPFIPDVQSIYYSVISSLGAFADARVDFQDAIKLYPDNKNLYFLYIDILIQQGNFTEAIIKIEDALVLFGVDEGTLNAALNVREKIGPLEIKKDSRKKSLSVCMIVKNEEQHLANCLKSIRDIADEIIIVDTGSTDKTKDIAMIFGAKVTDFTWTGDFSAARNQSLEQATGDWILVLDADEVISASDHPLLLQAIDRGEKQLVAYAIVTRNYLEKAGTAGWMENSGTYPREEKGAGWFGSSKVRLFKNNKLIRFENPVHELLESSIRKLNIPIKKCDVPVHHYGRLDQDKLLSKGQEYYELGRKKLKEHDGRDYSSLRELAVQAGELGRFEEAVDLWKQALALSPNAVETKVEALFNLAYNYIHSGKYADALQASRTAYELSPETKDALLNYALSEMLVGNITKTKALLEASVSSPDEIPTLKALLGISHLITGDITRGLAFLQELVDNRINVALYLNSFLKQLAESGQLEYFHRLIEAVIQGRIANHGILRLQLTPSLNKIALQRQAEGKRNEALRILKSIDESMISDEETGRLLRDFGDNAAKPSTD